jgi:hypothetical protein
MSQQLQSLPPCLHNHYDCKNCDHPTIALTPKGPFVKCDEKIWFCRFATPYSIPAMPACRHFSLDNYHCTHGGGTCDGVRILTERLFTGKKVERPRSYNKKGKLESEGRKFEVTTPVQIGDNKAVDSQEQTIEALKRVGGLSLF